MIKKKAGTITLAVGLITAGAVLFAQNFTNLPVGDVYKYWPLLLIGLGLEIVIYMSVYGRNNENVRLSIDGLCIAFIIVAAILGSGNFIGFRNMNIRGMADIPFIGNLNYKGHAEENISKSGISKDYNIKELKLTNSFGDIEIKKGNSKDIRLEAKVKVQYNDEAKARNYIKNAIKIEEGEVTNIYIEDLSKLANEDYNKAMVDFTVYIPEGITLDVRNSFGKIEVEGGGKTTVRNSNGEIRVMDCSQDVKVDNSFGRIVIENVKGSIDASNSNGVIDIKEADGNVKAETSFGSIKIEEVEGDIDAESKNGNVEIMKAKGSIDAQTSFGNVRLDEESVKNGRISAETSFGSINGFDKGNVKDSGTKESLNASYGNGSRDINLKTSNGNIEVR